MELRQTLAAMSRAWAEDAGAGHEPYALASTTLGLPSDGGRWPWGELQAWSLDGCRHAEQSRPSKTAPARARPVCPACTEPANQQRIERVDHLTGEMRQFSFCQRHTPRPDELARCQNARQLSAQFCPDD